MLTYDLDKRGNKTMYEYLYELIKEDIADGKLKADEKLPSKRGLSQHLQISVKTVENAYEQLLLEGYIRSEEKRGYYVNKIAVVTGGAPGYAAPVKRFQEETYLADLTANNIRYDRFPFATWAKVMRETLTDYNTSLLKTVPFNGVLQLREAIADHLNRYRGMQVSADHIIIGAGTEYLYNRLLQLLGPICNRIYDEMEVAQAKVKRCFECDEKLEEIIHKDVPISDGNYTEVEVKILGIIATLSKEEAMSAAEIGDAVGCSYQKVANWCSKVLAKKELINIEKRDGRNYYYD